MFRKLFQFLFCLHIFTISVLDVHAQALPISTISPTVSPVVIPNTTCGGSGEACCSDPTRGPCSNPTDEAVLVDANGRKMRWYESKKNSSCVCLVASKSLRKVQDLCGTPGSLECKQCIASEGIPTAIGCVPFDMKGLMRGVFLLLFSISGAAVLLCIVYSSFGIQASKGDPTKVKELRDKIVNCILGLVFLVFGIFVLQIVGGGILGFNISDFQASSQGPGNGSRSPSQVPSQPVQPQPSQQPNPYPSTPPIGSPSVQEVVTFFDALSGVCPVVNIYNFEDCLRQVNTGVSYEQDAKNLISSEVKGLYFSAYREEFLQCGSFMKSMFMIITGQTMKTAYSRNGTRCVKDLAEPFWNFEYFTRDQSAPMVGDMVKWDIGPCGHVGMVVEVINENEFRYIEANLSRRFDKRNNMYKYTECSGCLSKSNAYRYEEGLKGFYRLKP